MSPVRRGGKEETVVSNLAAGVIVVSVLAIIFLSLVLFRTYQLIRERARVQALAEGREAVSVELGNARVENQLLGDELRRRDIFITRNTPVGPEAYAAPPPAYATKGGSAIGRWLPEGPPRQANVNTWTPAEFELGSHVGTVDGGDEFEVGSVTDASTSPEDESMSDSNAETETETQSNVIGDNSGERSRDLPTGDEFEPVPGPVSGSTETTESIQTDETEGTKTDDETESCGVSSVRTVVERTTPPARRTLADELAAIRSDGTASPDSCYTSVSSMPGPTPDKLSE